MFKSYLITALRNMQRTKTTSLISVGGLAMGMCCALLLFLYIQYEVSYDTFHDKQDLIYRVLVKGEKLNEEVEYRSSIVQELADKLIHDSVRRDLDSGSNNSEGVEREKRIRKSKRLEKNFPILNIPDLSGSHYITDVVRMLPQSGTVRYKNNIFDENLFYFTEPAVFRMFDFSLQRGNRDTVLSVPGSIVLTPEMAKLYFADEDPLGKTIHFDIPSAPPFSFKVTGILDVIPLNSSIQIHFLASLPFDDLKRSLPQLQPLYTYTYIEFGGVKRRRRPTMIQTLLRDLLIWDRQIHVTIVANDFNKELEKIRLPDFYADQFYSNWHFTTEPFQNTYFARDRIFTSFTGRHIETLKTGNQLSVLLLSVLAILILIISSINVMSLSTARSAGRAKEIAIRKVAGADRSRLIFQFLTESTLLSFVSLVLSLSLVELMLPGFNHIVQRNLATDYASNWGYLAAMAGIALFAGLLSGIYPAFLLSSFPAIETMKGECFPASKKLRKWLLVFQITVSVSILIFSLFFSRESDFLRNKDPGFHSERVIFFKIDNPRLIKSYPVFKKELLGISGVSHVTASSLAAWEYGTTILTSFSFTENSQGADTENQVRLILADEDFMKVFEIPVAGVEQFDYEAQSFENTCTINQAARKYFNLQGVVGKRMQLENGFTCQVSGVASDFHYAYPWQKIEPLVIVESDEYFGLKRPFISIRILPDHVNKTIEMIERSIKQFFPENVTPYRHLDSEIDRIHNKASGHWVMILRLASVIAIFLSVLGLAGFADYEAERKTKEIGIRKALGATRIEVCLSFVQQFVPLILGANVIACALSFLVIPELLSLMNYPWPFRQGLPVFMASFSMTLLISLIVVSFLIFRVASVDPADALRDE